MEYQQNQLIKELTKSVCFKHLYFTNITLNELSKLDYTKCLIKTSQLPNEYTINSVELITQSVCFNHWSNMD